MELIKTALHEDSSDNHIQLLLNNFLDSACEQKVNIIDHMVHYSFRLVLNSVSMIDLVVVVPL